MMAQRGCRFRIEDAPVIVAQQPSACEMRCQRRLSHSDPGSVYVVIRLRCSFSRSRQTPS